MKSTIQESALRYSEQSNWYPEEGDILQVSSSEYKVYHNGRWQPVAPGVVRDLSKPNWNEYINKPFRDVKEKDETN